jgi:hypothetical protein
VPGLRQAFEREPTIGAVLRADLSIASLAGEPLIAVSGSAEERLRFS